MSEIPSAWSIGQDEVADFIEETQDCRPETGVAWLHEFLAEVKTVYAFQHLQGSEMVDGGNALHALRSHLWERGDAILRPTMKGSPTKRVSISCGNSLIRCRGHGIWVCYKTAPGIISRWTLAIPDHREAFLNGEMPGDLSAIRQSEPRR